MEELEMFEIELKLIQDNINRLKQYKKDNESEKWKPCQSNVVGEFKHRLIALKQRITLVCKVTTQDLF
jgi:hypothetical protein